MGDAYEYLIKKFADLSKKNAGEFYTPRTIVKLQVMLMDPKAGESVYDPACLKKRMGIQSSIIDLLNKKANKSKLDKYIISVINSEGMSSREKVVVLLAHFEEIVYQTVAYDRKKKDRIKDIASDGSKSVHKMEKHYE